MVATFNIFGRPVQSHILSMATLGTTFLAGMYFTRDTGDKNAVKTPPIKASSTEEEEFIKQFLAQAEAEEKKTKAAAH
ncbi:hypothetical protein DFH27DRAFT_577848 [Peziza echinospora]|nr:hypothetical protein DFH27DRAFT_577848 [Peziza echinospora]